MVKNVPPAVYRTTVLLAAFTALALAACASQPAARDDQAPTATAATAGPALAPTASPTPIKRRPNGPRVVAFASATSTPVSPATATASPSPSPSPSQTASPAASPSRAHKHVVVPMREPDAPPQIVDVEMNSNNVGSGDTLWGKVLTSSNVASVEVRVGNIGVGLNKVGVGRFTLAYRLPSIPFFVHGTYPMRIIARNSRGDKVERSVPLTIH